MTANPTRKINHEEVGDSFDLEQTFVHLARLSLQGRETDVAALARQSLRKIETRRPDLRAAIRATLQLAASTPARQGMARPLPVDAESRLELLRSESSVVLQHEPKWPLPIDAVLRRLVRERSHDATFKARGIPPTRSVLFVGAPGVGKTLAARWLAREIDRPIFTLDLAAVMNSFLGKTGANLRLVMDHAKRVPSVLLLDEFDSIAKRRDDAAEVGELKRLVTVLIQELDAWPEHGLLICATNHPDLLDPAIWRRFDLVLRFPMPSTGEINALIVDRLSLRSDASGVSSLVASVMRDASFSDIERLVGTARRNAIVDDKSEETALLELAAGHVAAIPGKNRVALAVKLLECGFSQRRASDVTGVARDTLRKHTLKLGKTQHRPSR